MRELCNKMDCQSFFWPIVGFWNCTIPVVWPIICIGLGIVLGTTLGVLITLVLFLVTAIWVPFRITKLLYVTLTTKECFRGFLGPILRIFVFVLIPMVPIASWIGGTMLCVTFGTLFFIGSTTQRLFLCEFQDSIQIVQSNLTLQPDSLLGELSRRYRELLLVDSESHPSIYLVKGFLTIPPGLIMATLVVLPYSLAILTITLYRLPINFYQTAKIALRTVLLRWDLRIVVLVLLPIIHLLFPILTMVGAFIGCFFWTWAFTSGHIHNGKHPGKVIHDRLKQSLVDYYQIHQDFVEIHCRPYDHPTGIPDGWDGRTYGIAVERLLRFQRDLVICCLLIVVELVLCLLATLIISILKYIPTCIHLWSKYITNYCRTQAMLGCWPFHLLAIVFLPLGVLIGHLLLLLVTIVNVPCHVTQFYWNHGEDWLKEAWNLQLDLVCGHDLLTGAIMDDYRLLRQLGQRRQEERDRQLQEIAMAHAAILDCRNHSKWDQVQKQCIHTTFKLLQDGYITQDQVADMDPSVIQSIPSVALWTVLIESCCSSNNNKNNPVGPKEIRWEVDGTVCNPEKHVPNDPVAKVLWPMVVDLKHFVSTSAPPQDMFSPDNVQMVTALLCSNAEVNTPRVEQELRLLRSTLPPAMQQQIINQIRVKITALILALLRVRPYQERMNHIFRHDYGSFPKRDPDEDEEEQGANTASINFDDNPANMAQTEPSCSNQNNQTGSSSTYGSIPETDE